MDEERDDQEMNGRVAGSGGEEQGSQPLEVMLSRAKRLVRRADEDARLLAELQDAMDAVAAAQRDVQIALDRTVYPALDRLARSPFRKHTRAGWLVLGGGLAVAVLLVAGLRRRHGR